MYRYLYIYAYIYIVVFKKITFTRIFFALLWGRSYSFIYLWSFWTPFNGLPPDEIDDENVEQILGVSNVWGNKESSNKQKVYQYIHAGAKKGMIDSLNSYCKGWIFWKLWPYEDQILWFCWFLSPQNLAFLKAKDREETNAAIQHPFKVHPPQTSQDAIVTFMKLYLVRDSPILKMVHVYLVVTSQRGPWLGGKG